MCVLNRYININAIVNYDFFWKIVGKKLAIDKEY